MPSLLLDESLRAREFGRLLTMNFGLRAELGAAQRSLKEIQSWNKGDVLILGQDAVAPLDIYIQEVPKLKGMMGVFRGNSAVRLTQDLSLKEDDSETEHRKVK